MLCGKTLTAFIPVRAGSKGIPGKNMMKVGAFSLLERSIKQAQGCSFVDNIVVSTDSPEMFDVAKAYDAQSSDLRPAALATDEAKGIDVVLHSIEAGDIPDGYVLLLQVTSPFRTIADLQDCCEAFEQGQAQGAKSIVSLVDFDAPHPDKIQMVKDGFVASYLGKESMVSRQLLPKVYALNGALYLTDTETLKTQRTYMPAETLPFIMPELRSVNLDTRLDLILLDAMLKNGVVELEEYQ